MSRRAAAGVAFWVLLPLWTWKLVEPRPLPEDIEGLFSSSVILRIAAAKTLHACSYGLLVFLARAWLPPRRPVFTFAVALLMLHGMATEIVQTYVPNRSGRAYDVVIDWTGIAIGAWISRRIGTRNPLRGERPDGVA